MTDTIPPNPEQNEAPQGPGFADLGLSEPVLRALQSIGYEAPSAIQGLTIPHILEGSDLVGQAQTGTGKTAAFALPLLTRMDLSRRDPQVLVLTPTRELCIQVAEAFHKYASHIPGFQVLPIYGGQGYGGQLRSLKRGVHVVVATPGRLCDHLRRGALNLDSLTCLVLDEADEMLRMGFIEDVEWILEQTNEDRQVALFSATMPEPIRRIAKRHLKDPVEISIEAKQATATTIRQRYWMVSGLHKLDALTRILEGEEFDGMIVFVRTKTSTVDLCERLQARGFSAAPLNGDIAQNMREQTIDRFRNGDIDILVATDVAARGLDVQRVSHVVNFDIPIDTESYIHRIGRTGRAGRAGEAILFVAPRERRLLLAIERATRQKIELMQLPSTDSINDIRVARFKQRIADTLAAEELGPYYNLVEEFRQEHNVPALEIASALAKLAQGDEPLLLARAKYDDLPPMPAFPDRGEPRERRRDREAAPAAPRPRARFEDEGYATVRYRLDVGWAHGVKPGAIVGAIANEGGLEGRYIGRVEIRDEFSVVDLPEGMPDETLQILSRARVCGRPLRLSIADEETEAALQAEPRGGPRGGGGGFGGGGFGGPRRGGGRGGYDGPRGGGRRDRW